MQDAPSRRDESRVAALQVSVLLADLSGFTALVDRLASQYGNRGAERLQEVLNDCFGRLTEIVDAAGGEVLSFPGDAALAVWATSGEATNIAELVQQSAWCGTELQSKLDKFQIPDGIELRLRVAIGAGPAWAALVGGVNGQWETVLQGEAVDQLAGVLRSARAGEVVLSTAASALVGDHATGIYRSGHLVVAGTQPPKISLQRRAGPPLGPDVIRSLVPSSVLSRIDAGLLAWLAEFRNVTVVFIQIVGRAAADHEILQPTLRFVQTVTEKFGGNLNQAVADDKGLTMIVAFGVVSHAHEDDAVRAVRSALELRDELLAIGVDSRFGISTGRVFVGSRGGASRCELAIMGPSVVLAARLASVAEDILADAPTHAIGRKGIRFESLPQAALKGKTNLVDVWRPRAVKGDAKAGGLIGRRDERGTLERLLTRLERERRGGLVILEGEPGIGKTALIRDLLQSAQSRATRNLTGAGDSIELRTTYLAWRGVAAGLVGADVVVDADALRTRLIDLLGADTASLLPLLNPVFPASPPENDQTLNMNAESRAQTTRDLLIGLLQAAARTTPLLVVLEDAHWLDSASWDLVEPAMSRVTRLLLVLSVRTSSDERIARLVRRPGVTTIRVGALDNDEIRELVCRRLDADAIPDELATLIHRRAEGHPLFAEELAVALRDGGAVVVRDGTCRVSSDIGSIVTHSLPDNVQGIVATRIDHLAPRQQLTLKVAAVLGRQFALGELARVHPLSDSMENVRADAKDIAEAGLLVRAADEDDSFSFSHALVQEVAYELLPFTQRRELHQRAAEWLEQDSGRNLDELSPLLAHHWEQADVVEKAMHYIERAGERALMKDSSNPEAEEFLTRLIALAERSGGSSGDRRQQVAVARWERMLSQAIARQSRHAPAMTHLARSITLLGQTLPSPSAPCRAEFLRGIAARLLWRPSKPRRHHRSTTEQLALLELVRAYDSFVQLMYLGVPGSDSGTAGKGDVFFLSGVAILRSLRAAELAGPSPELSRTYSLFANLVAVFRRSSLATYYATQGRTVAEEVGDRHALFCALTLGQLPAFIRGAWQEAAPALEQALTIGAELRNIHDCLIYEGVLAYISFNRGQLDQALDRFRSILARAQRDDHLVPQLWSTVSIGEVAFRQGRIDDAIDAANACLELARRTNTVDQNSRFQANGLLASAWLRKEGPDRAQAYIALAVAAAESGARLSYSPQFGFVGVAETLFALWDRGGVHAAPAMAQLQRWLRVLRIMAFCRPILAPWDLLFRAEWHRRRGRPRLARRRLHQAIRAAGRMGLTYEAAVARAELRDPRSSRLQLESPHPG
jgi:class 3 adenylate cyclase/tetratricopeptide (TPR) repeat protein